MAAFTVRVKNATTLVEFHVDVPSSSASVADFKALLRRSGHVQESASRIRIVHRGRMLHDLCSLAVVAEAPFVVFFCVASQRRTAVCGTASIPEAAAPGMETRCLLLELSHDAISIVTHKLCDPLEPLLAVHLSSTATALRVAMEGQLAELQRQRQQARALAVVALAHRFQPRSWSSQLRNVARLQLGSFRGRPLDLAHWGTLGNLARCGSLPTLIELDIRGIEGAASAEEGMVLLADGLRHAYMPFLKSLDFTNTPIGPQGAAALASALTKRVLPSLRVLGLSLDPLGDAGLVALAPAIRQLPKLATLGLNRCQITDLSPLLVPPTDGGLPSLMMLHLNQTLIGPQGAAALATALTKRALPSLQWLSLNCNPLGDAGLVALAPAIRQLPKLKSLHLVSCQITDLSPLLALPADGGLPPIQFLSLVGNHLTDEGCAALASALRGGAMPALRALRLPRDAIASVSEEAQLALKAARPSLMVTF